MKRYTFIFLTLFIFACSKDKTPDESNSSNYLITKAESVRLRAKPGVEGDVLKILPAGSQLVDLDTVSNFTSQITLNEVNNDAPWLKVKTIEGENGWVYGASMLFEWPDSSSAAIYARKKYLQAIFGQNLSQELAAYKESFAFVENEMAFARQYNEGIALRDKLVKKIDQLLEKSTTEALPDLFWLKEIFPGFVPQLVAEGTAYYLFADYTFWWNLSQKTSAKEDDQFIGLQLLAYPEDSIEYFYPAWTIQTWDYGGHSLLGQGIHHSMLKALVKNWTAESPFKASLNQFKDQLVQDMTNASVTYWEPKEKIIKELDSILSQDLAIFTQNDLIAIQTRRKHFEDPEANGLETNHKAGIY